MFQEEIKKAEELAEHVKAYVNNKIALVKLGIAEKVSKVMALLIAGMFVLFVFMLFIVFGSVTLALLLGEWLGHLWLGFLLVAILYLILGLITWLVKGRLLQIPIMNMIIRELFNNAEKDEDN